MVSIVIAILGIYFAIGFLFALLFVTMDGPKRIDPSAVEGTIGFRLIIIPGCALFWPLLLRRWLAASPPPTESSAHRHKF